MIQFVFSSFPPIQIYQDVSFLKISCNHSLISERIPEFQLSQDHQLEPQVAMLFTDTDLL